jgi:hypothetical protein
MCVKILIFHSRGHEDLYPLGYNAVYSVESQPKFRRNISGQRIRKKRNRIQHEAGSKQSEVFFPILKAAVFMRNLKTMIFPTRFSYQVPIF